MTDTFILATLPENLRSTYDAQRLQMGARFICAFCKSPIEATGRELEKGDKGEHIARLRTHLKGCRQAGLGL